MYHIKVNDQYSFETKREKEELSVNGEKVTADVKQLNNGIWHIINNLRSFNAEVISFNSAEKTAEIKVNNTIYSVTAKDQFDVLLDKLGLNSLSAATVSEIKAPMPGMVLQVFVEEGMGVMKGDNLFILEAMKMENIIKAPADVTVKNVKIKPGDKVEKGQVLMLF